MKLYRLLLLCSCLLLPWLCQAKPLRPQDVPPPLQPWIGWVLHGQETKACPFFYNDAETHRCVWPARLSLNLDEHGGQFSAAWQVDSDSWVALPGSAGLWPQQVTLDGKPAVVVAFDDGKPAVWLTPGPHRLNGRFVWDSLPENLPVPSDSGLLVLTVNGKPVVPVFNDGGLWLQGAGKSDDAEPVANSLSLRVFRQIDDSVPLQVVTHLDLEVGGQQREVLLAGALLAEAIPLALSSPLAARLEADGRLRLLLKPGRWALDLTTRQPGAVEALALAPQRAEPWPAEEVWTLQTHGENRALEVSGVASVDPRQTDMPSGWKSLPAYRLSPGQTLRLKTLRRGDPDGAPDALNLQRQLWLDFDGGGYTAHDEITGKLGRQWRLETLPGLTLGRVVIDSDLQLLTQTAVNAAAGVELRRNEVLLVADSRGGNDWANLPTTGWARDFQRVSVQMHLPPGWRLLAASGVDNAPGSWLAQWTLLDAFLLLVAALAVARLRGVGSGVLAVLTLLLLWHEADAPRTVWLHLLAAIALLRVLPGGRIARWVQRYRQLTALVLLLIALPFSVAQIRAGFYPQLGQSAAFAGGLPRLAGAAARTDANAVSSPASPAAEVTQGLELEMARQKRRAAAEMDARIHAQFKHKMMAKEGAPPPAAKPASPLMFKRGDSMQSQIADPNALTQTGPGLPNWQWRTVNLSWNGPVLAGQNLHLFLLSPAVNRLLSVLRVALLLALAWRLLGKGGAGGTWTFSLASVRNALPLLLLAVVVAAPPVKAEMPSPEQLTELQTRLLSAPDCLPNCAQIAELRVRFTADSLQQHLQIHAQERVAVPLPAQQDQWLPDSVSVDGVAATALFRSDDGVLSLGLNPGQHDVRLSGRLPSRTQVQLPLDLKPHRVVVEGNQFQVEGINENGVPEGQLQLTRQIEQADESAPAASADNANAQLLPPFLQVRRTLRLGLEWRIYTQVLRQSPSDAAVVVELPLLTGEAVSTPGVQVKNGKISLSLAPGQSNFAWESTLEKQATLNLTAPQTTLWTEVWQADVSPVWHLDHSGIAPARQVDVDGRRLPEWRPWPGESVTLQLTRPQGAAGVTLTLDHSDLHLSPGLRATDARLQLTLRSSQGGQHTLQLPATAQLQSVTIDGQPLPLRQQGRALTVPIRPSTQQVQLTWRQDGGIGAWFATPPLDLGLPGVNHHIHVELGQGRWVLWTDGPQWGPAVLFWGMLAVLVVVAVGLGRCTWTPLRPWHWLLLLIGLSQVDLPLAVCVVGWLLALGWRGRGGGTALPGWRFNLMQIGLALFSLLALACLFEAVRVGLLGMPDMYIGGNQSTPQNLAWYQDRHAAQPPQAGVLSLPLWLYRGLMLLWALWLANALLGWLRWGFGCYAVSGLMRAWRRVPPPASDDAG